MTDDEARQYGLRWGPWDVSRLCVHENGSRVIEIDSEHVRCQIQLSASGKAVTVYPMKGRVQMTRSTR